MTATMQDLSNAVRMLAVDALVRCNDGHPGTPTGSAEIATALFTRHLKFDPKDPLWPDRDRFIQSSGHGSMLIYALVHLAGYEDITIDEIKNFRVLGSKTPGHPEYEPTHGIEVTTGPLGQGIANSVGMAVAEQMLNAQFGDEIVHHYTYALVGDGCLMEGIGHEAISLAGHLRLSRLIWLYDDNKMTDDGGTAQAFSENYDQRFACAGWHVQSCDGHDQDAVAHAIENAKADPRPSVIRCETLIGKGVPRIENTRAAHGGKLVPADGAETRQRLGWPHAPFEIPDDIYAEWRKPGEKGAIARKAWQARVDALPELTRREFDRLINGELPIGWAEPLLAWKKERRDAAETIPTIKSSGEVSRVLSEAIPEFVGGAPDLEAATQHKREMRPFTADDRSGRYIHYGVREHLMGAMINGMLAHGGVVPFGTTFLVFSDYMRHAIRMSALMPVPAIWVFSHDSIGIGTNGPTHQPIEYLASLRAMPNLAVMRPADSVECAECWQLAVENRATPTVLVMSRQPLPAVRGGDGDVRENLCAKGAYILADAEGGPRQATIFATGSEVSVALGARDLLQAKDVPTAVVSVPCWELFFEQPAAYRDTVLGRQTVRVAVEAASPLGWERFVGENGAIVGMTTFGASGKETDLFEHFGITPKAVADTVLERTKGAVAAQ